MMLLPDLANSGLPGASGAQGQMAVFGGGTGAVSGGEGPAPDVLPAGRLWVGAYDADSVTVTASGVSNVDQVRIAAVPAAGGTAIVSDPITVDATYDFARTTLTGLAAGTEYDIEMRSVAGSPSGDQGWVKTRPTMREAFKVGFASCFRVGNDYTIFDTIIDANPGMLAFYNLGDRGYADIATNNVALYHAADDNVMAMTRVSRLHRTLPHLYMWDDHDYGPNDSAADSPSRPAAVAWFRNRVPMRPTLTGATDAPYYAHSPMPGVTVAMLDTRSERNFGGGLMISAAQEAWLIGLIQALPDGEALIINSSVPWIASSGSDMWFSASAQRQRIADAVTANCPGQVMIIGGDMHALAWDVGTNSVGGIPVAHAAPLGNTTSTKGGPYTVGPITTTTSQYGTLDFAPVTDGWSVRFEGWSVDAAGVQTRRIDATVTLASPPVVVPGETPDEAVNAAILALEPQVLLGPITGAQWTDLSGNNRNATIIGTQGTRVSEGPGGMPFFMGTTTAHAELPHDAAYNSPARTMLYWINPTSELIAAGVYRSGDEKLSRYGAQTRPGVHGHIYWGGSGYQAPTAYLETDVPFEQWSFWAATYDPTNGTRLYQAGAARGMELLASLPPGTLANPTEKLGINARIIGATADRRAAYGYSKFARFDKALTLAELQAIYDASIPA